MVRDAWSVGAAQRSQREHLLAAEEVSASEDVFSPTWRLVGRFFCFYSWWSNNTSKKCCMQNIPKVQDWVRVECISC